MAADYPRNRKGLRDYERLHLAVAVADALENYTNAPPTSTKEGIYIPLLAVVLGDALDSEVKAAHELARYALKYRAEQRPLDDQIDSTKPTQIIGQKNLD